MSWQTRTRASGTELSPISSEDLAHCRRDRDFTNILDLQNRWHNGFLRKLREHGHNSDFLWKQLQQSENARSKCIDDFLDIHGMEYWGDPDKRVKYLMPDSIARDDVIKYPNNRTQLKDTLVLLLKKKAGDILRKDDSSQQSQSQNDASQLEATRPQLSQTAIDKKSIAKKSALKKSNAEKRPASDDLEFIPEESENSGERETINGSDRAAEIEAEVTTICDEENSGAGANPSPDFVPMSQDMSMTEPAPLPFAATNITTTTTTRRVRRRTTVTTEMEHRMTPPSEASSPVSSTHTPRSPSNLSTLSLVDASLARTLYIKYRRDTFFLITIDGPRAAPVWHKYKDFFTASSFILDMGRAGGLENHWWTAEAQMMIDGGNGTSQADYVLAAKDVITEASITLDWSHEKILVRWDNNADWNIVRQLVHKAWIGKEFGFQMIDVFKVEVLLHLHGE